MEEPKEKFPEFYIEIEQTTGAVRPEIAQDKFIKATRETLESISKVLEASCQTFVEKIGTIKSKPSEISIEFGVDARGEGGIPLVTKGSIGANFKVSLKWSWVE